VSSHRDQRINAHWTLIAWAACSIVGCGAPVPARPPPSPGGPVLAGTIERLAFTLADAGNEFDAVIDRPAENQRNGWGVLLIGGGLGNDLDWTTPGTIHADGNEVRVTISGAGHADAPAISRALCERGFTVMRYSTIARSDPLASQWPIRSTPRSLDDLTRQARSALGALHHLARVDRPRILLLGHSLGAARACTLAAEDHGIGGLILLAPAYFRRTQAVPASFTTSGLVFGEEVIRAGSIPCLALFGSLDRSRAVDAAAAAALGGTVGFEALEVRSIEGLGHQLGPQEGALIGPIDPRIIERIAAWAESRTRRP
jgi:predicted esterase